MPGGSDYQGPADSLEMYTSVVNSSAADLEVKGAKNPYTSRNGQMFRESLVGRIGESAVQQAVHLRLEESLGNAQAMRADLASIAPIAQGEGVPEDGLDQAWEAHRPARGRLQ